MKKAPARAPGKEQLPSQHGARLHYSRKKNPCPIRSRAKDGARRWGTKWIACHTGGAANVLRPGQALEILGQSWHLSRTNDGDSGAAHIFRPHCPGQQQIYRLQQFRRSDHTLACPLPIARPWLSARGRSHRLYVPADPQEAVL